MSFQNKHDEAKLLDFEDNFLSPNESFMKRPWECQAVYMELYLGPSWNSISLDISPAAECSYTLHGPAWTSVF